MKLKTFERFEDDDSFLAELTDFAETNLAYLLDDSKYKIEVMREPQFISTYKIVFGIDNSIRSNIGSGPILWTDIKDHILQFYHILQRNYELRQAPIWMVKNSKDDDNYIAILPTNIKMSPEDNWNSFSPQQLEWVDIGYLLSVIFYVRR
jgi:hypothetical protein